jgi:site-specific DNA recombinase
MRKAAIYARVSTLDKQSYTRQVDELKELLRKSGYLESQIDVYAENESGYKKTERLELNRLIEKVEADPKLYDYIYTSEISRIGRNPSHARQVIDRWTDLGVPLYIHSLNDFTIKNGKRNGIMSIILQVLMEYADMEAETFKTRSRSGLRASAKKGKAGGGINHAYGYTVDSKGYLIINEEEATVVREIFDLYLRGNGIKVISGILNERKIQTRTNKTHSGREIKFKNSPKLGTKVKWSDKQIHDILCNTLYKGERKFKGEIIAAPAIISSEVFDQCTELRGTKTHRNYLTKYTYLLKDILICGKCGRNYFAKYKPVKGGDKVYICSSRLLPKGNCGNVGLNITLVESVISSLLFNNKILIKYLGESDNLVVNIKEVIEKLTQKLLIEEKEKTALSSSYTRLEDLYIHKGGIEIDRYLEKKNEIERALSNVSDKISLIRKQLEQKQRSLSQFKTPKKAKEIIEKAKRSRADLQTIYRQYISKVVFTCENSKTGIVAFYMQLNGIQATNPVHVMLDLQGIKKQPPSYRYKATYNDLKPNYEGHTFELDDFDYLDWNTINPEDLIQL